MTQCMLHVKNQISIRMTTKLSCLLVRWASVMKTLVEQNLLTLQAEDDTKPCSNQANFFLISCSRCMFACVCVFDGSPSDEPIIKCHMISIAQHWGRHSWFLLQNAPWENNIAVHLTHEVVCNLWHQGGIVAMSTDPTTCMVWLHSLRWENPASMSSSLAPVVPVLCLCWVPERAGMVIRGWENHTCVFCCMALIAWSVNWLTIWIIMHLFASMMNTWDLAGAACCFWCTLIATQFDMLSIAMPTKFFKGCVSCSLFNVEVQGVLLPKLVPPSSWNLPWSQVCHQWGPSHFDLS